MANIGRIERRYDSTYFQIEIRRIKIIDSELRRLNLGITVGKMMAASGRECAEKLVKRKTRRREDNKEICLIQMVVAVCK